MESKTNYQKGKDFENYIAKELRKEGFLAYREIGSGNGKRKGDIFSSFPFLIEVKNQETIKIKEWIRQSKRDAGQGFADLDKWALVFRDPESPEMNPRVYATIDFWQLVSLVKKVAKPRTEDPDKDLKWKLSKMQTDFNSLLRELEKFEERCVADSVNSGTSRELKWKIVTAKKSISQVLSKLRK